MITHKTLALFFISSALTTFSLLFFIHDEARSDSYNPSSFTPPPGSNFQTYCNWCIDNHEGIKKDWWLIGTCQLPGKSMDTSKIRLGPDPTQYHTAVTVKDNGRLGGNFVPYSAGNSALNNCPNDCDETGGCNRGPQAPPLPPKK